MPLQLAETAVGSLHLGNQPVGRAYYNGALVFSAPVAATTIAAETFAAGTGSWLAFANAGTPTRDTARHASGALRWTATAGGGTQTTGPIYTGFTPNTTYTATAKVSHENASARTALLSANIYDPANYLRTISGAGVSVPAGTGTFDVTWQFTTGDAGTRVQPRLELQAMLAGQGVYLDSIEFTTVAAPAASTAWEPNLAGGTPVQVLMPQGGAGPAIAGTGSAWSINTDAKATNTTGKVLSVSISANGQDGVKARAWIPTTTVLNPAGPWRFSYRWWNASSNPIREAGSTTTKQMWGFICKPTGTNLWAGVSDNAVVFPDSWSLRLTTLSANYLQHRYGPHPFTMNTYFYGQTADGTAPGNGVYGREDAFRVGGTGAVVDMGTLLDQWVDLEVEVTPNSQGSTNGTIKAWLNGALVVSVPNVKLCADGFSNVPTAMWLETFNNSTVATPMTFLYESLRIS